MWWYDMISPWRVFSYFYDPSKYPTTSQFKGLSVYDDICGTGFTCLSTGNFCHNELHKQTCGEGKRKQTKQNKPKQNKTK